jgi:sulfur-carrier protein
MNAREPLAADTAPVRVVIPHHLRNLARVTGDVVIEVAAPVTVRAAIDALETDYPALTGTIRDRDTGRRRAMIRIYADGEDYSDVPPDTELPPPVAEGREPLRLIGAIAGG